MMDIYVPAVTLLTTTSDFETPSRVPVQHELRLGYKLESAINSEKKDVNFVCGIKKQNCYHIFFSSNLNNINWLVIFHEIRSI